MELTEAPPLVALVFQDKGSYADYGRDELGGAIDSIIGYYSLRTNRIATYDLTGIDDLRGSGDRITSATHVNQILVRPQAERTVATVIHEATHQLAFNSGLQTRFADIPLWLSEGLAIYFETPDLTSKSGWRTIGGVNHVRLRQFHGYLRSRPENSLATLLGTDARFRDTRAAADAYAEAWALCYYLIRYHRKEFVKYLQLLAEKQPMNNATPHDRLRDFESVFGMNLQELNTRFLRQFSKVH
jgi:hypothetical protein